MKIKLFSISGFLILQKEFCTCTWSSSHLKCRSVEWKHWRISENTCLFLKIHLFSLIYRIIPITFQNPNSASQGRHGEIVSVIVTGLEEETLDYR